MQFFVLVLHFMMISQFLPELHAHKFYVSTTEVELKREQKTLQVTTQLFIDDLELLLRQSDGTLRLDPDSNQKVIDSLLSKELKSKLEFSSRSKILKFNFLGKEYREDISLCYIEVQLEEIPEKLNIKNVFFFNIFDDQQNIIHFKTEGVRKSFLLHENKPSVEIELKK